MTTNEKLTPNEVDVCDLPVWLRGKEIDEVAFCCKFTEDQPLQTRNKRFYLQNGNEVSEDIIEKMIYDQVSQYKTSGLDATVRKLLNLLKISLASLESPLETDRVYLENGVVLLTGGNIDFHVYDKNRAFCRNTLPVCYDKDASEPGIWKKFLSELFEKEDICTLQEYLGYCLIPSKKAQKMLIISGEGGCGKSCIGQVLQEIFGSNNLCDGGLYELETNRFTAAELEGKLLVIDDDMKTAPFPHTHKLRKLVTEESPMQIERKGVQAYSTPVYARVLAFTNGTLISNETDDILGALLRRVILLTTKAKDPGRKDDPGLSEKMCQEKKGIFLWMLEGLQRVLRNHFQISVSQQTEKNLLVLKSNNIDEFLEDSSCVRMDSGASATTRNLYGAYLSWCEGNALNPQPLRIFSSHLKQSSQRLGLTVSNKIIETGKKQVRGFQGIEVVWAKAQER